MRSLARPAYPRDKARSLRVEKRLTIDELAERLALPRTTIYHWLRDLPQATCRQTLPQELGTRAMTKTSRTFEVFGSESLP